jgi:hypothetical protein
MSQSNICVVTPLIIKYCGLSVCLRRRFTNLGDLISEHASPIANLTWFCEPTTKDNGRVHVELVPRAIAIGTTSADTNDPESGEIANDRPAEAADANDGCGQAQENNDRMIL